MSDVHPRGLIIAAPRSGAGKTTVALGLMRALRQDGITVQPFKVGPDYIDPAFHTAASGRASINLDTWAMRGGLISELIYRHGGDAEICIVEGVMGLFDGAVAAGQSGRGSTADLAALTGWPVILVLDVWAQAETAAAVALGCKLYRDDVNVIGVILNGVSSPRHESAIAPAIRDLGLALFGSIPRRSDIELPERHLGLVQALETDQLDNRLENMADLVRGAVRIDLLREASEPLRIGEATPGLVLLAPTPPGQRIALAQDQAFSFIYPHLLDGWRRAGAEIVPFSPLNDEEPQRECDAVWLPGGYPELHAHVISAATHFKRGMHRAAERGVPVHGECGGYMVLGTALETADGCWHRMLGMLGLETSFAQRQLHLGYRYAVSPTGDKAFGHEFHYATVVNNPDPSFADIRDASGNCVADQGGRRSAVTGTFFHLIDADPVRLI